MLKYFVKLVMVGGFVTSFGVAILAQAQSPQSTFPNPREVADEGEWKPHVGVKLGPTDPAGNYNNTFGYGIEYGYQPYVPFGLAAELYHFQSDHDQTANLDLDRTQLLLKGTYNFGGTIPVIRNSYVGADLGPVVDTVSGVSYLRVGAGLLAGMDFFVKNAATERDAWSVGANASFLWVSDSDADALGVNGVVKYWF